MKKGNVKINMTYLLIAINIICFIITACGTKYAELWGTNYNLTFNPKGWYRLLSSMFFHFGFMHILCNMYTLYNIGPTIEKHFGSIPFLIVYFVTGIVGGALSCWIHHMLGHNILSVGASGAIMGLLGFFIGSLALPFREKILMILHMCWPMIIVGFLGAGIDNVAHFTCLAVGMLLAYTKLFHLI